MRKFATKAEFLAQTIIDGELVEFSGHVYKTSLSRTGPWNNPKDSVMLIPVSQITVTPDTEITVLSY